MKHVIYLDVIFRGKRWIKRRARSEGGEKDGTDGKIPVCNLSRGYKQGGLLYGE